MASDVEVRIPARPEYVGVVRHVVGATARLLDLPPDSVDNAKLAASESVTSAVTMINRAGGEGPIVVRAEGSADRFSLEVEAPYRDDLPRPEDTPNSLDSSFDSGLSRPLLESLVEELDIAPRGDGTLMRMTIIPGPPE